MIKTYTGTEGSRDNNSELFLSLLIRKTILQQNLAIGTTAVAIPTSALSQRVTLLIFNNSTSGQILYLGDSTVSSSNGFPIYPRGSIRIDIEDDVTIYGISSALGANIRIIEGA